MKPRELIDLLKPKADDPVQKTILKSKYNRYASRLNEARFEKETGEHRFLLDELSVLKKKLNLMIKYIAYYRVSTKGQGQSGLGLEAQKAAVAAYVKENEILAEFQDIESGKKDDRPELAKAIHLAKEKGAKLIIAKLDGLSRNLTFISSLMDNHISFVCCDIPEANEFTIHIFAALAQQERKMISARTKAALEAKRAQGVRLGKPENLTREHRMKGGAVRAEQAREDICNKQASKIILRCRKEQMTFTQIAKELNVDGYKTSRGKMFSPMAVKRLLDRNSHL